MANFQAKTKEYEIKRIEDKEILDLIQDYNQSSDYDFLISEFQNNYNINQYYTRNIFKIIEKLIENKNFSDEDNFCMFLEEKLENIETLSSLNRDIFIKLYLKLTQNTENVKKLYDEYITKNYINVSTIEDFTEFFLDKDWEELYFIKSFLYNKEWWFRLHFFEYKSWIIYKSQNKILNFSKESLELFFDELNKKENIWNLLHELHEDDENIFCKKLEDKAIKYNLENKAIKYNLENKLYEFLISQIKFAWNSNEYFSKNAFFNRNINSFNNLKNKSVLNYQQFFVDIKYWEPWYYYYREFENFIFLTIENKKDLEDIMKLEELKEKEYIIRNWYFDIKYRLKNEHILNIFNETIPEKIIQFEEENKIAIENNQKYENKIEQKNLEEISENLEKAKDEKEKLFVPKFLDDFINKYNYLIKLEPDENKLNKLVETQIKYFFNWKVLNINDNTILKKFEKTDTWYNAPWFLFDWSFSLVFQSAQKIWYNLSQYKQKLAWYYSFQWNWKNLADLKKYFWIDEIKIIIDIYKLYPDIRGFQSYNIISLFKDEKYNFNQFFEEIKQDNNLKNDLIYILEELNKDENFSKYYLKNSLDLLFELWVEKSYFQILEWTKPSKNYFKDILQLEEKDDEFKKYTIINEFLIKNQDKDAFLWRVEQLLKWFIEIPDYEFENGEIRTIYDLEHEINNHVFIKILEEYKYINKEIEEKIIELIEKSFEEYDKYENYCKYIWQAVKYYLRNLSKDLVYNNKLIDKITELLSNSENINKNIEFKIILWEISDKFLWKVEKVENEKKYIEKIRILKEENQDLNKKLNEFISHNIEIYTEWKTDWKHLVRAWYELEKQWKLEKNNINKNIIDYLIKYNKDIWWWDKMSQFTKTSSQIKTKKLIIWIFDTDWDVKDLKTEKKNAFNYLKIDDNYYQQFLHIPNNINDEKFFKIHWICIEFYYDDKILDVYNFYRLNKFEKFEKFSKSIRKINDKLYLNWEKTSLIIDKNMDTWQFFCELWKKINSKSITNNIYSKNQFAEDIAHDYLKNRKKESRHNNFYKEPNIKTWDRFLPIFVSLTKIIEEWHNKDKENIKNQDVKSEISEEKINNKTLFQKIFSTLKSIFTQQKI